MKANEYQQSAAGTAMYPSYSKGLYPILGLIGEAGELVAKFYDGMWPYGKPIPDGQERFHEAMTAVIGVARRCETLKKLVRGGTIDLTDHQKQVLSQQVRRLSETEWKDDLVGESADVCWYICALLTDLDIRLEDALAGNLAKLAARQVKGQIHAHRPDSQDHKEVATGA